MKSTSPLPGLLLAALVYIAGHLTADAAQVNFTATIDQSPFATPGYTVGTQVTGWFEYDNSALPYQSGINYTDYYISASHLSLGAAEYQAGLTELSIAHSVGLGTLSSLFDLYEVWGYQLAGPNVEGFQPAASELLLADADYSIYAGRSTPYPVDLPDPGQFETKTLRLMFFNQPNQPVYIDCTVTSIAVVPEPAVHLLMTCGLCALAFVRRMCHTLRVKSDKSKKLECIAFVPSGK